MHHNGLKLIKGLQVGKKGLVNATLMSGDASALQHAIGASIPRGPHGHGGKGGHATPIVVIVVASLVGVAVLFGCMAFLTNWFLDARDGKHRKLKVSQQELEEQVHGDDE